MGAERRSSYIDEKVKRLTAYHEGGHALAALYTDGAMPLHKVTCVPRGHALGVVGFNRPLPPSTNADEGFFIISKQTSQLPKDDRLMVTQKEFLADIDVALGGRVAEELIFGAENVTSGASSDLRKATATATRMVKASSVPAESERQLTTIRHIRLNIHTHRIGVIQIKSVQCISTIRKSASPPASAKRLRVRYGGKGSSALGSLWSRSDDRHPDYCKLAKPGCSPFSDRKNKSCIGCVPPTLSLVDLS